MTNTEYSTTDICLAAYLLCVNHPVSRIDKLCDKGTFVFKDIDPSEIAAFDNGSGNVEPQRFHSAVRQLTSAVRRR